MHSHLEAWSAPTAPLVLTGHCKCHFDLNSNFTETIKTYFVIEKFQSCFICNTHSQ